MLRRRKVTVVTDASGVGVAYTSPITGYIRNVIYEKADFADTVDFAITGEVTGTGIWAQSNVTASATKCPLQPPHNQVGVQHDYYGAGDTWSVPIPIVSERVKFAVAQGGANKSGVFVLLWSDS